MVDVTVMADVLVEAAAVVSGPALTFVGAPLENEARLEAVGYIPVLLDGAGAEVFPAEVLGEGALGVEVDSGPAVDSIEELRAPDPEVLLPLVGIAGV